MKETIYIGQKPSEIDCFVATTTPQSTSCIDASGINVLAHSRLSLCTETLEVVGTQNHLAQSAGFEPARAEPNRFLVCRLNHSAMTAYMKGWTQKSPCANKGHPWVFNIGSGDHHIENSLSEVGFEPTPGEPDCDLNAAP